MDESHKFHNLRGRMHKAAADAAQGTAHSHPAEASRTPASTAHPYLKLGVYTEIREENGEHVFLKQLTIPEAASGEEYLRLRRRIERQIEVGEMLDHSHHARLLRHEKVNKRTYNLIYTVAPGEQLESLVTSKRLTADDILIVAEQLASALAYSHHLNPALVHGDITPRNVHYDRTLRHTTLYDHSASRADFASEDGFTPLSTADIGTFGYTAPEILEGHSPSTASDIYGLGCLLKFMIAGRNPDRVKPDVLRTQARNDSLVELIEKMTGENPLQRPTAEEVSDYIQGIRNRGNSEEQTSQDREKCVMDSKNILAGVTVSLLTGIVLGILVFGGEYYLKKHFPLGQASSTTITESVSSTQEQQSHATSVELTPLQQWQEYERAQRDLVYNQLLGQIGEDSFYHVLYRHTPLTLSFLDKWHPSKRLTVGPRQYLFELRPVSERTGNASLQDSSSLAISLSQDYLYNYQTALRESAFRLGVDNEPYVDQMTDIPFALFYESVRNPTTQDLGGLYAFVHAYTPRFIVDAFYETAVKQEIAQARQMIAADPVMYGAQSLQHSEGYQYWSPVVDTTQAQFVVQPTRYENGELKLPETTGTGEHIIRGGSLILPEQWEKKSAFTKWLYRRGPLFIDNFEIMLDAYRTSNGPDEFTQRVMQEIHR
jgi:serine/threonine protein kinase